VAVRQPSAELPAEAADAAARFSPARTEFAAEGIVGGLSGLRNGRVAFLEFGLTVLSWLTVAFAYTLALRGAGLELGLDAGILVAVATTFSLLLPALPASVGILEAAPLVALDPYASTRAGALSRGRDPRADVRPVPDPRPACPERAAIVRRQRLVEDVRGA
jgi:uncharacterized membrane protein YbhN (UPF0104 family)